VNTEPVKTTLRLIAAIIGGADVISYEGLDLLQAFSVDITDAQQAMIVSFITVVVGVVAPVLGIKQLRDQVTPWSPEAGAMTPGPSVAVQGPEATTEEGIG
jgi:hypothetical protein